MRICLACLTPIDGATWSCSACGWHAQQRGGFPDLAGGTGTEGFGEESFELLPDLEERSFWFQGRNELIVWALRTHAPEARSFLEIGCGTGFVLQALSRSLPRLHLVGGEPHPAGLREAVERTPTAELVLLDARSLPFRDEFDAVGAFDVLEHIQDDELALRNLRDALRPSGLLVLTVPQHRWLWSPVDEFSHHCRRYERRDLLALLVRLDLEVLRTTSFVSLLLPVVGMSRLRQRGRPVDPQAEYRLPPLLDRTFGSVLALERRLIARGVSLPLGSSLLVVARRPGKAPPADL